MKEIHTTRERVRKGYIIDKNWKFLNRYAISYIPTFGNQKNDHFCSSKNENPSQQM